MMASMAFISRLSPHTFHHAQRAVAATAAVASSSSTTTTRISSRHLIMLPRCKTSPKGAYTFNVTPLRHHPRKHRMLSSSKESKSSEPLATAKATETVAKETAVNESTTSTGSLTMWQRFLGPKPMPERNTAAWYREMLLICTVFGITGSSTMLLVRPAVSEGLGIRGSFKDGPWSYRICSIVIMTPIYATLLVAVGTVFGRHAYFRHFSVKIFSRFGIPPEALDSTYHQTKANFRKW